jgi:predicted fused transcriptional regulator/phosphomethylpyrimidine kinase
VTGRVVSIIACPREAHDLEARSSLRSRGRDCIVDAGEFGLEAVVYAMKSR